MMKYDYVFLDLDGPVLDGRKRHYQCYKDIMEKYGGRPIGLEKYWGMKRNRVNRRKLLEFSNFTGTYDEYMCEWLTRIEQKRYLKFDFLQYNTETAVKKLREHTKHLYLVTMRKSKENLIWQLEYLQILELFEQVICGALDERQTKYELIKNIDFENALFIGDTEADLQTAKLCGSEFKAVLNGIRNEQAFQGEQVYSGLYQLVLNLCGG